MSLYDTLSDFNDERRAADRQAGRGTSSLSTLAYTPEMERRIAALPAITPKAVGPTGRRKLQAADGKFSFGPDPLGSASLIPGTYYINSLGKMVPY